MVKKVEIYILDVSFGDAIFIKLYNDNDRVRTILIDTGRIKYIKEHNDILKSDGVNCLIITHKHGDHMGYVPYLLEHYKCYKLDSVFMRLDDDAYASPNNFKVCKKLKEYVQKEGVNLFDISDKNSFDADLAEYGFSLLYPKLNDGIDRENPNRNSIVLSLIIGDSSVLFMGDATSSEEKIIYLREKTFKWDNVRFIKIGHHGSKTSSQNMFLNKIKNVEYGVISVSKNKRYGLPDDEFLDRWNKNIIKYNNLLRTENCESKICHTIKITIDRNGINGEPEFIS